MRTLEHPTDHRSSLVEPTLAGSGLLDEATPVYDRALAALLGHMLPEPALSLAALRAAAEAAAHLAPALTTGSLTST